MNSGVHTCRKPGAVAGTPLRPVRDKGNSEASQLTAQFQVKFFLQSQWDISVIKISIESFYISVYVVLSKYR